MRAVAPEAKQPPPEEGGRLTVAPLLEEVQRTVECVEQVWQAHERLLEEAGATAVEVAVV